MCQLGRECAELNEVVKLILYKRHREICIKTLEIFLSSSSHFSDLQSISLFYKDHEKFLVQNFNTSRLKFFFSISLILLDKYVQL